MHAMSAFVVVCTANALIAPPVRLREVTAPRSTSGDYLAGLGQSTIEEVDAVVVGCGPAGQAARLGRGQAGRAAPRAGPCPATTI